MFHRVTDLRIGEAQAEKLTNSGKPYTVRHISFKIGRERFEFALFGDTVADLILKHDQEL